MPRAVIIGGGISGLSAAYYLSKAGVRPTLIEQDRRLGGVVRTDRIHDCLIERGPDSFLAAKPWAMDLITEVGLGGQVIGSNDQLRVTYIWKNGKLAPLPDGMLMMVPTQVLPLIQTSLLSWGAKLRMGLEFFRRPNGAREDRSVHDFLLDHYGQEAIDYLAEPLLAGVYGGDPRQMSANSVLARFVDLETRYGSLSRGVLATPRSGSGSLFRTLKNGLGQLIERLEPSADIVHGTAEAVERHTGGYRVRVDGHWVDADRLVIATPAYGAAHLLRPIQPQLSEVLLTIPYTSSVTLALGYRKSTFDHPLNGFGFLVPKKERQYLTACTWVNNKFSGRAPEDVVLLRCFLGSDAIGEADESLIRIAKEQLRRIMGVQAEPSFSSLARWPNAMAQYTVGHEQRMGEIEALTRTLPGLRLIGNGYRGIGIPDCVRMGKEAATVSVTEPKY